MDKTIIIGLDGADFNYIDPMIERGLLPNIKSIMDNGFQAALNSSPVPYTFQAWATILTGTDAGRHLVYDMKVIDRQHNESMTHANRVPVSYIWDYAVEQGIKTIAVNVPMTYPARSSKGVKVISGFDAPIDGEYFCYPDDFMKELKKAGIEYTWHKKQDKIRRIHNIKKNIQKFKRGIWQQYTDIAKILKNQEWELFFTVFQFTDWVNHRTRNIDCIEQVYIEMDKVIGEFLKEYRAVNIFIISDHGSCPALYRVSINRMLSDLGLLHMKFKPATQRVIESGIRKVLKFRVLSYAISCIYAILPKSIKAYITRILSKFRPHFMMKTGEIDFSKTKAFYIGLGSIFINSVDKFERGIVKEDEIPEIKRSIEEALSAIKSKSGEEVIEFFDSKDVWHLNPEAGIVPPDIIIRSNVHGYYIRDMGFSGNLIEKVSRDIGVHSKTGILIGAGPEIPKKRDRLKADLIDFGPTLFDCIGIQIPKEFKGKSLFREGADKKEYHLSDSKHSTKKGFSKKDLEKLEKNLSDLGYL